MIKLRIKNTERIEKQHYKRCSEIILNNREHCIGVLENIIYNGEGINEPVIKSLLIGKRSDFFSEDNPLFNLTNYYKSLKKLHSVQLHVELKMNNLRRTKENRRELIHYKVERILNIAEDHLTDIGLYKDFARLKDEIVRLLEGAEKRADAQAIANLFYSEAIVSEEMVMESITKVFSYDEFCSGGSWNRKSLLNAIDISVCPYCNRQYITMYENENTTNVTADLDHYYAKSTYPYLGLALYNFIPSCQICNSRFKLKSDFYEKPHIYPYEESFGKDGRFIIVNDTDIKVVLGGDVKVELELDINGQSENSEKIKAARDTFRIKSLYQQHAHLVKELVLKKNFYNKSKLNELTMWLKNMDIDVEPDELKQMLFSNYIGYKEFSMKPLSKFTYDILEYLEEEIK